MAEAVMAVVASRGRHLPASKRVGVAARLSLRTVFKIPTVPVLSRSSYCV